MYVIRLHNGAIWLKEACESVAPFKKMGTIFFRSIYCLLTCLSSPVCAKLFLRAQYKQTSTVDAAGRDVVEIQGPSMRSSPKRSKKVATNENSRHALIYILSLQTSLHLALLPFNFHSFPVCERARMIASGKRFRSEEAAIQPRSRQELVVCFVLFSFSNHHLASFRGALDLFFR